jgi:glycosyltransferase involved in cell wall biosynthesis
VDVGSVDYSIVIPVYFNAGELSETFEAINRAVLCRQTLRGEIIFVDDGSGDGSLEELLCLRSKDPQRIKVIKLTRNFGQVNALFAGFSHAQGRCVVAISADGQDPPALINQMLKAIFEENYEIVACAREGRDESAYRVVTSKIFYWLMRKLSFPSMPPGGFDFLCLGRRAVNALLRNRESHSFIQGQILWTGFRTKFIPYRRAIRKRGRSRWTFGKKLTYLIDGVMSYSFFPIRLMSLTGLAVALMGFLYAVSIAVIRLLWGMPVQGWAPLMIMILLMGGVQMIMLGVIGEYLWRTLAESRNRDTYIIEEIFDSCNASQFSVVSVEPNEKGVRSAAT